MKIVERPNKQIVKLLLKIADSDAVQLYKVVGDEWKKTYFTASLTFADFTSWIKKNLKED